METVTTRLPAPWWTEFVRNYRAAAYMRDRYYRGRKDLFDELWSNAKVWRKMEGDPAVTREILVYTKGRL